MLKQINDKNAHKINEGISSIRISKHFVNLQTKGYCIWKIISGHIVKTIVKFSFEGL